MDCVCCVHHTVKKGDRNNYVPKHVELAAMTRPMSSILLSQTFNPKNKNTFGYNLYFC